MVYIKGEEMTRYTMDLIIKKWIDPHFDTGGWEYFDLSCKNRDDTEDKCLFDAVAAGARIGAIFKGASLLIRSLYRLPSPLAPSHPSPLTARDTERPSPHPGCTGALAEPTVTPTAIQKEPPARLRRRPLRRRAHPPRVALQELLGLKKTWGSPNGALTRPPMSVAERVACRGGVSGGVCVCGVCVGGFSREH